MDNNTGNSRSQGCVIFEDNQSNFELLERMVQTFRLNSIKFELLETALSYLEIKPTDLVIIDSDAMKENTASEVTSRIKEINPRCVVVWVCAHEQNWEAELNAKPDIILTKPFGIMLFQQVLTPYIFSQSICGHKNSKN